MFPMVGGILNFGAVTLTSSGLTGNSAVLTAGGVCRINGTMTTTNAPIGANTPNNCVGSTPAVPNRTG
jgi:hypothetical protein